MEMTTVRLSKASVDFMKSEGKYEETLADIGDRLFAELKSLREESKLQGNGEAVPAVA
jgi:prefoldin subunit 5